MPTNATPINIGKAYYLRANDDNGKTLFFGDASSSRTSVKTVQWVPDLGTVGDGFSLVSRIYGPQVDTNGTAFTPIPYRRVALSGSASDRGLVSDTLPVDGFLIEVPANGQTLALVVSVTSGGGWLYSWDAVGSAT
jgi:hypothetical protein